MKRSQLELSNMRALPGNLQGKMVAQNDHSAVNKSFDNSAYIDSIESDEQHNGKAKLRDDIESGIEPMI